MLVLLLVSLLQMVFLCVGLLFVGLAADLLAAIGANLFVMPIVGALLLGLISGSFHCSALMTRRISRSWRWGSGRAYP